MAGEVQRAIFDRLGLFDLIVELRLLAFQRGAFTHHFGGLFHAAARLRSRTENCQLSQYLLALWNQRLTQRIGIAGELQRHFVKRLQLGVVVFTRDLTFDLIEYFLHFRQFYCRIDFRWCVAVSASLGAVVSIGRNAQRGHSCCQQHRQQAKSKKSESPGHEAFQL